MGSGKKKPAFGVRKGCYRFLLVSNSGIFKQNVLKKFFAPFLMRKSENQKIWQNFSKKLGSNHSDQSFSILRGKIINTIVNNSSNLSQLRKIWANIPENVNKNNVNRSNCTTLNLDKSQ